MFHELQKKKCFMTPQHENYISGWVLNNGVNKNKTTKQPLCKHCLHILNKIRMIVSGNHRHGNCQRCLGSIHRSRPRKFDVPTPWDKLFFPSGKRTFSKGLSSGQSWFFCPSNSIYLKANALLGMGPTVIQSQPSWSCLPAWHAWWLYHVYWSKTRLKLVSTENIKNQFEPNVWIKGHSDRKMQTFVARVDWKACQTCASHRVREGDIILLKSEKWWAT